jgi:hypothetical protein
MEISREDHLQWCKDRALEYVELGDLSKAIASMTSDIQKHPQTRLSPPVERALLIPILFNQLDEKKVSEWINGFD